MEETCIIYSELFCIEKNPEVNRSSSFCCIARARIVFRMDGQTMSNAIVADRLVAAEATNTVYLVQIAFKRGLINTIM